MLDRKVGVLHAALLALAFVLLGGLAPRVTIAAQGSDYEVVDSSGIYFGRGSHPRSPAEAIADSVWAEIPEYKQIVEEELTDDDPKYHILLRKATARFDRALSKAAERDGYDMIGEAGSIARLDDDASAIPDITDDLIDLVSR